MEHKHRFVAYPVFGQKIKTMVVKHFSTTYQCEICYKRALKGDIIEAVKSPYLALLDKPFPATPYKLA